MDPGQLTLALAPSALPTLMVLVGILINNRQIDGVYRQIDGVNRQFDSVNRRIDDLRSEMVREFDASRKLSTEQLRRVEDVMDARLKHLEEEKK